MDCLRIKNKLEMRGKAQRAARSAQRRLQKSVLLDQSKVVNFLSDAERSMLTRASMLRCGMSAHRMKVVYVSFCRFASKIGYHSNVP